MDTASYEQFAEGNYLTAKAMEWFWDAYAPALMIVDECDVLPRRGRGVRRAPAGERVDVTTVRYDGAIHEFMMLNPLSETRATRAAIARAISVLRAALR
jgi:acetyl esterase/lipase